MSPATIHEELKMLDIIPIDYNPLMTILRVAKTKSRRGITVISRIESHINITLISHKNSLIEHNLIH
jgi:uncharacterized protein YueI